MCLPGTVETVRDACERGEVPRLSRRAALAGGGAAALAALLPAGAGAHDGHRHGRGHGRRRGNKVADLTHVFRAGFPVYVGDAPARRDIKTFANDGFYSQEWTFGEHSGTHMDAPGHFVEGKRLVPQLLPEELFAPIAVIDISERAAADPDSRRRPGGHRRLRAAPRPDPARRGGADALGLGRQGR